MSTPNLPPFSQRMCEVLYLFLNGEKPWQIYGNIADNATDEEDRTFEAEVRALEHYFKQRSMSMQTIEQVAQQQKQRITCESTGRLIATVSEQGMTVWCKYQKQAEFISWETLDALRAKCENAQRTEEKSEAC